MNEIKKLRTVNHLAWIPLSIALPITGQVVYGASARELIADSANDGSVRYAFWLEESWDPDEPLGRMTHWQPAA